MKKAKIMLLAITVMAIVGGVLAFKAKTVNERFICTTTELVDLNSCSVAVHATYLNVDPKAFDAYYTTDVVPVDDQSAADAYCTTRPCDFVPSASFELNP